MLPDGPMSMAYTVSVLVMNGDGDTGEPVETSVDVIGPPASVTALSLVSVSLSGWSFEWEGPVSFWHGNDSQPVLYVTELSCGNESMSISYANPWIAQRAGVKVNFEALWETDVDQRRVKLWPEDVGAVVADEQQLVCYQGDYVKMSVHARNRHMRSVDTLAPFRHSNQGPARNRRNITTCPTGHYHYLQRLPFLNPSIG